MGVRVMSRRASTSRTAHCMRGVCGTPRPNGASGCRGKPAWSSPCTPADVVVVPSLGGEPFGRVIIETRAKGCPAVVSHIGGTPRCSMRRSSGSWSSRVTAGMLASALGGLVDWRHREPALAGLCRDHVRDRFSVNQTVEGVGRSLTAAAREG